MNLGGRPLIDYEKYVSLLSDRVTEFIGKSSNTVISSTKPTEEWVAEQLLSIFARMQHNVTPAKITEMIVSKWRALVHELNPPCDGEHFTCFVEGVDAFGGSNKPVLRVATPNAKQSFHLWMHPSLQQFIGTSILAVGRQLRMIAQHMVHDTFMLPVRAVVVEMGAGKKSDLKWVRNHCKVNCLSTISTGARPDAIMATVVDVLPNEIFIVDDSIQTAVTVHLTDKEQDYSKILKINDFIVLWRPEYRSDGLHFSDKTIVIRLPVLRRRGPDVRDCSVRGIVDTISHRVVQHEWLGCEVEVVTKEGKRERINFDSKIGYDQKKQLSSIRSGHFVWCFHLVASNVNDELDFNSESTMYNLNSVRGLLDSMIARPVGISAVVTHLSGVIRATIVDVSVSVVDIHLDCGCVVLDDTCPKCSVDISDRKKKEVQLEMLLEDGSTDQITVYGTDSTADLFGYDAQDWIAQIERVRQKMMRKCLGTEYVFFITRCNPIDIGKSGADFLWRVDAISDGREETDRLIRVLRNYFETEEA